MKPEVALFFNSTYLRKHERASTTSSPSWFWLGVTRSFSCLKLRLLGKEVTVLAKSLNEHERGGDGCLSCRSRTVPRFPLHAANPFVSPTRWNELNSSSSSHTSEKHILFFSSHSKASRLLPTGVTGSRQIPELLSSLACTYKQSSCSIFRTRAVPFAFTSWRASCDKYERPHKLWCMTQDAAQGSW